jgi:iron complex outermembrane recepter protein
MNSRNSPRFTRKTMAQAVSAALFFSATPVAFSQTAAPQKSDSEVQTIDKVVVSAQKRDQAAIDVPASVATVTSDRLTRSGMVRLEDFAAQLPGVSVTAVTRGFTSVVLRGISTGISQATPATAFYVDDAPVGSITAYATGSTLTPDLDPYELRRVEVLKGPQGTLYGASAVGGLFRYVSVPAEPGRFSGSISVGANKVSEGGSGKEVRGSVNIPLDEKSLAVRISGFDRSDAGYIDNAARNQNDINKANTRGGRAALDWKINKDWALQSWAMTRSFRGDALGVQDVTGPGLVPVLRELDHAAKTNEKQSTDFDIFNATLKGRAGDFNIVASATHQKVSSDVVVDQTRSLGALFSAVLGIPGLGAQSHQVINTERWSQEIRARSFAFGDKLSYEVGLFLNKEDSTNRLLPEDLFNSTTNAPVPLGLPLFNAMLGVEFKEVSVFGNATYSITPQFDLTAGLRHSKDKQHFFQNYQRSLAVANAVIFEENVENKKTTYLLSGIYKPSNQTAYYGRVATGYRAGGPSALPANIGRPYFDPDSLTSFELGFKSAFAAGLASVEAAVFTTDWKDIQVQRATTVAGTTYQHFVNAGKARSRGAEATLLVFPVKGLTLRATTAFTDSKLTEDAPVVRGLNGDRMPFVPKVSGSLAADYRFPFAGVEAWVGGTVGRIGERRSNFSQQPNATSVPAYTTVGLNAGVDVGKLRITLSGKNLNDARGINFINTIGLATGANPIGYPYAAGVIQPRTIGIDMSWQF